MYIHILEILIYFLHFILNKIIIREYIIIRFQGASYTLRRNEILCIPAYATSISWTSDYQQPREFSRYVTRVQTQEGDTGASYDDNTVFLHADDVLLPRALIGS